MRRFQDALGGRGTISEQEVEFNEVSARSLSTFGGPDDPAQKLAGIQLAHFGAFYKSSWRANDWMWGRVDAVHRLVRLLLDPERLRTATRRFPAGNRASAVAEEIHRIATTTLDPALANVLAASVAARGDLERELAYLDDDRMMVPEALPLAVEAVSGRLEGEIFAAELPGVARAVEDDRLAGCFVSETAASFSQRCRDLTIKDAGHGAHVPGDKLRELLVGYTIGKEKLEREIGTDRLSAIATQAIAVAVSSARTQMGVLAIVGRLMNVLRAPTLLFYVFARDVQYRSRTGVAANVALLAVGAAIVATEIFAKQPYSSWVVGLAVAALLIPVAWSAMRWPGAARKIRFFLVLLVLLAVADVFFPIVSPPELSTHAWQDIAAAGLGVLALNLLVGFWPWARGQTRPKRSLWKTILVRGRRSKPTLRADSDQVVS